MIRIEIDDRELLGALTRLIERAEHPDLAMREIGERLTESTQARFAASTAPDGSRWAPNAQATILDHLGGRGGFSKKTGKVTARGSALAMNKRPLVASGLLRDSVHWDLIDGGRGVEVGTDRFADAWEAGAAVHQFGSRDGRIPARPFLGVSGEDRETILDVLEGYLSA
jgi:phage gpG-like protein